MINLIKLYIIFINYLYWMIDNFLVTSISSLNVTFFNFLHDYLQGNIMFEELGIELIFDGKEILEVNHIDQKVSNFTIALTILGILSIYNSLVNVREIVLGNLNPNSVKIYI